MSVEFAVLGPLQVRVDGRELRIGGFTRRATLGFLLLGAGRVVSISELTTALWPDAHPPTARGILLNVVSALRKAGLDLVTRAEQQEPERRPAGEPAEPQLVAVHADLQWPEDVELG